MKFDKRFWIIIIIIAVAGLAAWSVFKPKGPAYKTEAVKRGDIVAQVSETGSAQKGEVLNLNFKNSGMVAAVEVAEGQRIAAGQVLARLDDAQTKIQLRQARANLELYRLQLEKLQAGASIEDIDIVQSQTKSAQTALAGAEQSLADAKTNAGQKSDSAYKSAADALVAAYTKIYNAYNFADLLQRTYFSPRDPDSISVWETLRKMNGLAEKIKSYSQTAQADGKDRGLDPVFAAAKTDLIQFESHLRSVRAICEKTPWRDTVSQTDKDSMDVHIGYVVAAQASFNSAVENIALQKAANDLSINAAQTAVDAARAALATAGGQLQKTTADPRGEDVGILEAQIAQANAQIELLETQINDAVLFSPIAGQVSKINVKTGETVSMLNSSPAVAVLPDDPYEVKVDIYEEETAKIKIGDPATIEVAAVSEEKYLGRVKEVAPAGKLVNGVVYYETKIAFENAPKELKPDMTADVVVTTASKNGVLLIAETSLRKKPEGGYFVQVLQAGKPQDVDVQVGLRAKGQVEIVSGLSEGDLVVIP